MIEKPMKTLAVGEIKYVITDAEAREDIGELQTNVTNINNHVTETDAEISDLKSAVGVDYVDNKVASSAFTQGNIADTTGSMSTSTTRIRTANSIDLSADQISVESGYKFSLYAYNGNTYLGGWTGSTLNAGYNIIWMETPFAMSNLSNYTITRLIVVLAYTTNAAITPADANEKLIISKTTNYAVQALASAQLANDKADENAQKMLDGNIKQSATFTATATGNNIFDVTLFNGRKYTITNASGGTINLKLVKSDSSTITVSTSIPNGNSLDFICEISDCIGISVYFNVIGDITLESIDSGLFASITAAQGLKKSELTTVSMFQTLGAVGDSFTSGGLYGVEGVSGGAHYNISWPQILARHCGMDATNYSVPGYDISKWLTDVNYGLPKLESDSPRDLYVIFMGINTEKKISDQTADAPIGTTADIDLSDPTQNADTFIGHYGRMLSAIINHAPNSKIIVVNYITNNADKRVAIPAIAEVFNVPVIDLQNDDFYKSTFYTQNMHTGHPIAATYAGMAVAFERQINECIVDNISYFTDYVGN